MKYDECKTATRLDARALDTRMAPGRKGEEVWESVLTPVTSPDRLWKQPFGGSVHAWSNSDAMLCDVRASDQVTRRDARQLSLGPPPLYTLLLVCRGRLRYKDSRQELCLMPGDVLVEDMAEARTLVAQRHRTLQLILPYSISGVTLPDGLHGTVLPRKHTATRLLARHMLGMRAVVGKLSGKDFNKQLEVGIYLALAALPASKRQSSEMSPLQQVIRGEIERYIEAHLTSPELNAKHLGKVFRISRSHLYRLFRATDGPSAYIRLRRLQVAAQQIQKQHDRPDQWDYIAESLGFGSISSLDRALRERLDSSVSQLAASVDDLNESQRADTVTSLFQRLPGRRNDSSNSEA